MCRGCTKPGANHSRSLRPRLPAAQGRTGTMTGRVKTKPREGVSLRGVHPALRISLATLVACLLLERAASPRSLHDFRQQGSQNAPTSTSPKLLTVCRMRQALQFRPLRSTPSGSSLNHRRMNGGIHIEAYHDNLSSRQKGTVSPVPLWLCQP